MFIIDTKKEHIAVTEANKLGMPIVAVVDTNCDPDLIQYVIPGNDDAIRAGKLMCRVISDAVEEGRYIASRRHAKAVAATPKPAADALDPEAEARRLQQQAEARRQAALQAQEREARLAATRRHQQAADIAAPEATRCPPPPSPPWPSTAPRTTRHAVVADATSAGRPQASRRRAGSARAPATPPDPPRPPRPSTPAAAADPADAGRRTPRPEEA